VFDVAGVRRRTADDEGAETGDAEGYTCWDVDVGNGQDGKGHCARMLVG
jgi:hypothetical protein